MRRAPLVACLLALALPAQASAIVNGQISQSGDWPWQVGVIGTDGSHSWMCGGSLVAPDRVVTAAHCTAGAVSVSVSAGSNVFFGGQQQQTSAIAEHPQADTSVSPPRYDVALLGLPSPVTGADGKVISTIAPEGADPASDALWAAGADVTVTGWGITESGSTSSALREAVIDRRSDSSCASAWGTYFRAADMLCALRTQGATTLDACNGDSGGPLVAPTVAGAAKSVPAQWRLVGVVSWGSPACTDPAYPGVYARVGAATINDFVNGATPVARPESVVAPSLSGDARVGGALTCSPGEWSPAATSHQTSFYRLDDPADTTPLLVGTEPSYTVADDDVSRYLACVVTATNAGGTTAADSALVGPVAAPGAGEPAAPAGPSPLVPAAGEPTTPIAAMDHSRPTSRTHGRVCRRRRCRISVTTTDRGTAGVRSLEAGLTVRRRTRCGAERRPCTRSRSVKVGVRRLVGDLFQVHTPRLAHGRYTLRLVAVDRAGNRQRPATLARFRVR